MLSAQTPVERIAHRGSPRELPENTLPGFLLALEHGADAVELDVHVSADGVAVVHHDPAVQQHPIAATPWSALSPLDLGGGARIPALRDVLIAIADRATVYIELKGSGIEAPVLEVARAHGRRWALHSFDHGAIARVKAMDGSAALGVLLDRDTRNAAGALRDLAARIAPRDVWPHHTLVDARFMDAASQFGMRVVPWTVNSRETARHLATLGAAGLCTDDVRLLFNL